MLKKSIRFTYTVPKRLRSRKILYTSSNLSDFGQLIHENWLVKSRLSDKITANDLDVIYENTRHNGALGGKLLGAGGGWIFPFLCASRISNSSQKALSPFTHVPFSFENQGAHVIFQ